MLRPTPTAKSLLEPVFQSGRAKDGNLRVSNSSWDNYKAVLPDEVLELR
jgi:hypothetical protein